MTVEAILTLHRSTDVPRHARDFVGPHLVRLPPSVCEDVVLLVSELVTNVVRHGAEPARLVLSVDERSVHVLVHDCGPALLANAPSTPDAGASSGRGLIIVAALASSWGITYDQPGPGKGVWFTMAVPA